VNVARGVNAIPPSHPRAGLFIIQSPPYDWSHQHN
jgi:hypothetical protein